jgi:hypothetical protein
MSDHGPACEWCQPTERVPATHVFRNGVGRYVRVCATCLETAEPRYQRKAEPLARFGVEGDEPEPTR